MGKDKNPRRVADNEAMAKLRMLRTSPQKLNLVAGLIRGKKVEKRAERSDLLEEADRG
jgi:large subunit ribosomal protein L22